MSIRLAVACAQTGSLTSAARDCNLVLPAASRRIRELEDALGDALFERHSRGLAPHPRGPCIPSTRVDAAAGDGQLVAGARRHPAGRCTSHPALLKHRSHQPVPSAAAGRLRRSHATCAWKSKSRFPGWSVARTTGAPTLVCSSEGPDTHGWMSGTSEGSARAHFPRGHPLAGAHSDFLSDTLDEPWISLNAGAAMLQQQQQAALAAGRTSSSDASAQLRRGRPHGGVWAGHSSRFRRGLGLPILRAMKLAWRPLVRPLGAPATHDRDTTRAGRDRRRRTQGFPCSGLRGMLRLPD